MCAVARQTVYRELFHHELEPGLVDEIRKATNDNYVLGDTHFAEQISKALEHSRASPVDRIRLQNLNLENCFKNVVCPVLLY